MSLIALSSTLFHFSSCHSVSSCFLLMFIPLSLPGKASRDRGRPFPKWGGKSLGLPFPSLRLPGSSRRRARVEGAAAGRTEESAEVSNMMMMMNGFYWENGNRDQNLVYEIQHTAGRIAFPLPADTTWACRGAPPAPWLGGVCRNLTRDSGIRCNRTSTCSSKWSPFR